MTHLKILNPLRDFSKDLELVKQFSEKIDKKLSKTKIPDDSKIEKLTLEELQDLNKILGLANFLLCKYEEKKETRSVLQHFVSIITDSAESIENLDEEISELILSAEDSFNKVKYMNTHISENSDLEKISDPVPSDDESGSINLTNFSTEINTLEYQHTSQEETAQVI